MFKPYISELVSVYKQGDAREESYYPALKKLFESYADYLKKRNISVTVLPKKTEAGNPDFRVWDGKQKVVGYIEAKAP
ncbi:MAG: adenine methyltransferase, partial [Thermotogae bacterium]